MIVCPACRRHHRELVCPFCRTARPAGVLAAGLTALALTGCPPAPVYGGPPLPDPVTIEAAPIDTTKTPAPPYGAAPPQDLGRPVDEPQPSTER